MRLFATAAAVLAALWLSAAPASPPVVTGGDVFHDRARRWLDESPAPFAPPDAAAGAATHAAALRAEQLAGAWFAALTAGTHAAPGEILLRLASPADLEEFVRAHHAVLDVHAVALTPAGPAPGRRLTAAELAARADAPDAPPVRVLARWRGDDGALLAGEVHFGARAAELVLARTLRALRERALEQAAQRVLSARDDGGAITSAAQQAALDQLPPGDSPAHPSAPAADESDPFVAFVLSADLDSPPRLLRFVRRSELRPVVEGGAANLRLRDPADAGEALVRMFRLDPLTGRLHETLAAAADEDSLELRVQDLAEPRPTRWPRLVFGEPQLLLDAGLASFGLVEAHLEHARKRLAWRKSTWDLVAEPVFAGLSIGGGLSGVGFPLGDAARFAYNLLVAPNFIPHLPTTDELRDLLRLAAAKQRDPELVGKHPDLLTEEDLLRLEASLDQVTEADVAAFLAAISDEDLRLLQRLARLRTLDAKYRLLADIISSGARATTVGYQEVWRDVFNNAWISLSGEISIKNIVASAFGRDLWLPRNYVPLEELIDGDYPGEAWMQNFDLTVDVRALMNSVWEWTHADPAEKRLGRPVPHAPTLGDLAAYEVRAFGFPLLFFHKRGLIRDDLAAYTNDFAYTVVGTRVAWHFPDRAAFEAELGAGRMQPLGFVKRRNAAGELAETGLLVFLHRVPEGRWRGRNGIVLYGLRGFTEQVARMDAEVKRFRDFQSALDAGAVITRTLEPAAARTAPEIRRDAGPAYAELLADLRELDRARRLARLTGEPPELPPDVAARLATAGVDVANADEGLLAAEPNHGWFRFARRGETEREIVQWTRFPGREDLAAATAAAQAAAERADRERAALADGGPGVLTLHRPAGAPNAPELGPLLRLVTEPDEVAELLAVVEALPAADRQRLVDTRWAGAAVRLDADGDGQVEEVILGARFPAGGEVVRDGQHPLTREFERRRYRDGRLVEIVRAWRLTRIERDADGRETATRTFRNTGGSTLVSAPGELLAETRTIEWFPPQADPGAPRLRRRVVNDATGEQAEEIWGGHDQPLARHAVGLAVTNFFNTDGRLTASEITRAGRRWETARPVAREDVPAALLRVTGQPVLQFSFVTNHVFGTVRWEARDPANEGRLAAELARSPQPEPDTLRVLAYDAPFAAGEVPVASATFGVAGGALLSETVTTAFDLATRTLVARQADADGRTSTLAFVGGGGRPRLTETPLRRTETEEAPDGLGFTARTVARDRGGEISRRTGRWLPDAQTWRVEVSTAAGPGPVETWSPLGRLLEVTPPDGTHSVVRRDADGRVAATETFAGETLVRRETPLAPTAEGWPARVETFVGGRPHTASELVRDAEGRLVVDGRRDVLGRRLETRLTWQGGTDDLALAETWWGDARRERRTPLPDGPDRRFLVEHAFGLTATNVFPAGDTAGRWTELNFADGAQVTPLAWQPGLPSPLRVRVTPPDGSPPRERELTPAAGVWRGEALDREQTWLLTPAGTRVPEAERALAAETDIPLFANEPGRRLHFAADAAGRAAPAFATAEHGGVAIVWNGRRETNVVALFTSADTGGTRRETEVDLRGLFAWPVTRRVRDAAGVVVEEAAALLTPPAAPGGVVDAVNVLRLADALPAEFVTRPAAQVAGERETWRVSGTNETLVRRSAPVTQAVANPWLPAHDGWWTLTREEDLDRHGAPPAEVWRDARGTEAVRAVRHADGGLRLAVRWPPTAGLTTTNLWTASGASGADADWRQRALVAVTPIGAATTPPALVFRDARGREVRVAADATVQPWSGGAGRVWWLPDEKSPSTGIEVSGLPPMWFVVVPALAAAGLEVGAVTEVRSGEGWALAGFLDLPFALPPSAGPPATTELASTAALVSDPPATAVAAGGAVRFEGVPVAVSQWREGRPPFAVDVLLGRDALGRPRPLYAVEPYSGRFVDRFETDAAGQGVLRAPRGLEAPRLEHYDPAALTGERAPAALAFGRSLAPALPAQPAHTWPGRAWARFVNRLEAGPFRLAGDALLGPVRAEPAAVDELRTLQAAAGLAVRQARRVAELPTLAGALAARGGEFTPGTATVPEPPRPRRLAVALAQLRLELPGDTGLIPTAPGTPVARFVDTVGEAWLIRLAVQLGEPALAGELVDFYWRQTDGGLRPVLESYDGITGGSFRWRPELARPDDARSTASAQLALADAAWAHGTAAADTRALTLARNLTRGLWRDFAGGTAPRGLAETPWRAPRTAGGVALWPDANRFPVAVNAEALTLFRRLAGEASAWLADPEWRLELASAAEELRQWLERHVQPEIEAGGVVPAAWFEWQDAASGTVALAPERSTATDAWLAWLEAAPLLGWTDEQRRASFTTLLRLHGAAADGRRGLDWTIPLHRDRLVGAEPTAAAAALAARLGLNEAAAGLRSAATDGTLATPAAFGPPGQDPRVLRTGTDAIVPAAVTGWPAAPAVYRHLLPAAVADAPPPAAFAPVPAAAPPRDFHAFLWTLAAFYLAIAGAGWFWGALRAARERRRHAGSTISAARVLVADATMALAERRWAERVLGAQTAPEAPHARWSNAPVEPAFLMQLRALHKLVVEWRRCERGWAADEPEIATATDDVWLNGFEEFAVMLGIWFRFVIKAGRKDGLPRADVFAVNEDSNHLWSRLVAHLSEFNAALVTLLEHFREAGGDDAAKYRVTLQIEELLRDLGVRRRIEGFDARELFDAPRNPTAFDLLLIQQPGVTLRAVAETMEARLGIPVKHFRQWLEKWRDFKRREQPYPVHPWAAEAAKLLPHFLLMGLLGLVWHNFATRGLPIYPSLQTMAEALVLDPRSLLWAVPLALGFLASVVGHYLETYRYAARRRAAAEAQLAVDVTLTSVFSRPESVLPGVKPGRRWDPRPWIWAGWLLRVAGLAGAAAALLQVDAPGFAAWMLVKALLAPLLLLEAAAILLPLALGGLSRWLEDFVSARSASPGWLVFLNRLNISALRPVSVVGLALKYLFAPAAPTGTVGERLRATAFYLVFSATFLFAGGYLYRAALEVWFADTWRAGYDVRLLLGAGVFWSTMYLLRFGIFMALVSAASAAAQWPLRTLAFAGGSAWLALVWTQGGAAAPGTLAWAGALVLAAAVLFEEHLLAGIRATTAARRGRRAQEQRQELDAALARGERRLAVVYMSGDDLGHAKLTPALLRERWEILRDRLHSPGLAALAAGLGGASLDKLVAGWTELYELEQRHGVTLWHADQLVVGGAPAPGWIAAADAALPVADDAARTRLVQAWHARRWLVVMMSTAGHAQDTAINLVDIALRLARERLAARCVFYLISNKYEAGTNNRPSQLNFAEGELGQRERLARLLEAAAPGARAWVVHDWTPFGFKAGGMVGMDLVPEEALDLTHMLVLDRNATCHDLDALMADVRLALGDPGMVIVVPGRGTTNTRTPLGQGSQALEEGHRVLLRGVHALGGGAGEAIGTGWGNLQAILYGPVQRALVHPATRRRPLTARLRRGAGFAERVYGMIGFGPHAVGISEDIWGVTQQAHNALALGRTARFGRSRAFWHKIRETWSHGEWLAAFPRWSGGFVQLLHDPLMQKLVDFGPLSVPAKELRMNGGRFYLGAPVALLTLLAMPLAILFDFSPFVEILVVLWLLGLVMNQVLTVNSLLAHLEGMGFRRMAAAAGGALAVLPAVVEPALRPAAPGLLLLGALLGGFGTGVARWLFDRGRDLLLFGPQLVIHALGQLVRQSLEFVVSGAAAGDAKGVNTAFRASAGPNENRPADGYPGLINLRSVVWFVGLPLFALNTLALARLDFLNVLLLLPTLLFSVSVLLGPFLMAPRPGRPLGGRAIIPRLSAWVLVALLYLAAARLVAAGGWGLAAGLGLVGAALGGLLAAALRYARHSAKLRRAQAALAGALAEAGLKKPQAAATAAACAKLGAGPADRFAATLKAAGLAEETLATPLALARERLAPLLNGPAEEVRRGGWRGSRWWCDFSRSWALALLVLLWFFLVPVPGLIVMTAGEHRFGVQPGTVAAVAGTLLALVLTAAAFGWLGEWLANRRLRGGGLHAELATALRRELSEAPASTESAEAAARRRALLTDALTYHDQRAAAFAARCLRDARPPG